MVPDEVVAYAAGHYGEPPAPIDPDVLDRIMASPRAGGDRWRSPPEQPTLEELRARHGTGTDDDLLILKALIPERRHRGDAGGRAGRGATTRWPPPEIAEIRALMDREDPVVGSLT